jgi:hypothetical protein
MSRRRHPSSHNDGGVPVSNHSRRALCRESIWAREIYLVESSWGRLFPRRRCRVVLIAMVPQDRFGRGASFCMAIRGSCLYGGRGGPVGS